MCGRFAFYSPSEATAALFSADGELQLKPRYNIAPTQTVAAIRSADGTSRELVGLRWGLIPSWAKDAAIGNRMINARAETVAEKPSYRTAFRHRRCVVLADGFYEWQRQGTVKTPHYMSQPDGSPFGFAGLWESWTDRATGEVVQTTTLLTTEANDFMQPLHHRMPVILQPDMASEWLMSHRALDDAIKAAPALQAWTVSRDVNNARNQGPELIVRDDPSLD